MNTFGSIIAGNENNCDSCHNELRSYHTNTTYTIDIEQKKEPISYFVCRRGHIWQKPLPDTDLSFLHKILKVNLCWYGEKDGSQHPCCYSLCEKPHQATLEYLITGQPLGEMDMGFVTREKLLFLIKEDKLDYLKYYDRNAHKWNNLTPFTGVKREIN